jgi:hypothetical protein
MRSATLVSKVEKQRLQGQRDSSRRRRARGRDACYARAAQTMLVLCSGRGLSCSSPTCLWLCSLQCLAWQALEQYLTRPHPEHLRSGAEGEPGF